MIHHCVKEQEICKLMIQKHIANGDIDFDDVIELEQHDQIKSHSYK